MKQAEYYVNQKQYQDYILNFIDKNVSNDLLFKLGATSSTELTSFKKGFIQGMMFAAMCTCKVKTACIEIPEENTNICYDNCTDKSNRVVLNEGVKEIKTSN